MMSVSMCRFILVVPTLCLAACQPVDLHPLVAPPTLPAVDSDGDGFFDDEEAEVGSDLDDPFSWNFGGDRWPDFTDEAKDDGVVGTGFGIGQVMEDFEGEDQFGNLATLYQFYGYVIVLDFVAGWCEPCSDVAATSQANWEADRLNGFLYIHVVVDDDDGIGGIDPNFPASWSNRHQLEFPVLLDSDHDALNGVTASGLYDGTIPFLIVLDRDMRIDSAHVGTAGAYDADARALELL